LQEFEAGALILSEGDDAQDLFMLASGSAEECKRQLLSGEVIMKLCTAQAWGPF